MLERSDFHVVGSNCSARFVLILLFEGLWLISYRYDVMQINNYDFI